jgi:hypothetical protein
MSKFTGESSKVRCVDCLHLSGNMCSRKDISVSPKKRRSCTTYKFKGEYQNRTPVPSIYVPHVDKATRKMIRRLMELGIVPVREDGSLAFHPDGSTLVPQTVEMPRSTATATMLGTKSVEQEQLTGSEQKDETPLIWTPDGK